MSLNLACLLRESAKNHPDKNALVWESGAMTFAQLDGLSDQLARGLRDAGYERGDRIGIQLPNIPQFVISYFAVLKAGCVAVPMNVLLRAPEVAFQLENSGAKALFTWAGTADEAARAVEQAGVTSLYVVNTPSVPEATVGTKFEALMASDPSTPAPFEQNDPGDTAVIIYTSGTTGTPKGAELTHFQLFMNADTPGRVFDYQEDDVSLVILPLFHIFALSSQLHVALRFGGTLSLLPRFEPEKVVEAIKRDKVTVFVGVPTMYIALLQMDVDPADFASLRVGVSGGAAIPGEVIDAFEDRFGIVILEGYGLTESASTTTFNVSEVERRKYSVGKPIWGVDVEIWNDEDKPLPAGADSVGEIVIRGLNVMKGYYDAPEATEKTFTRGWFRSGDLGYFDEDGFLFIVDRKKDMIIRGGYNVYPRELEEVLFQHAAVAEAAVIGIPDDRLGEEVKAYVVLKKGEAASEADIIEFMKERVAAYKYPRSVEFRDELEHGPSGKVLKARLR